jgi:diguanylate cyclase (GGDEF)-like protein
MAPWSVRPRRRLSVTTYLLAAFGTCTVFLTVVVALGTQQSFERERAYATHDLRAITRETQYANSGLAAEFESMADGIAEDPRLASLDPTQCQEMFGGFKGFLLSEHIHVFAADGSEVCSVYGTAAKPKRVSTAGWLDEVVTTGETVELDPATDPSTGEPAVLVALPFTGPKGAVIGAMVYVAATGREEIVVPPDAPDGAVIMVLDRHRDLVLSASANAPVSVGDRVGETSLGRPLEADRSITDIDGAERIYQDVEIDENGWHVLAGVRTDVALAPARAEMRRNVIGGGITLGLVFLLGGLLHRRLARPIRRVGRAISESLDGDVDARAPLVGPSELAHVANAFNDLIEERLEREADLWRRARHDSLTGLPNRTALSEYLNTQLGSTDSDSQVIVLFLDLDRFKHINDAYGHETGDEVLVELGERLQATMRGTFISRFGGDEYVLVATGPYNAAATLRLAQQVAATMKTPIEVNGAELHLTGSVGVAVARRGDTAEDLIRNADTAMYRSKEQGTDGYAIFDQPMREWVMHRASTEHDLHQALERDELWLGYQPKVELADGNPAGFEALARWNHPTRGPVRPLDFIPIAEDSGLISTIGVWALESACRQAAAWRVLSGGLAVPVAVNLAARQLADPKLPDLIAEILDNAGARPDDLVLEITESAVLGDTEAVSKRLRRLRDAGVRVSLDDFSTGYSSLSYLQQLPIDELKIDRAFVSRLSDEQSSTAIIGSVIDLAHAIGLSVVAEGVETIEQFDTLRDLGCDLAQGFYVARPAPAPEATAWLCGALEAARRKERQPALPVWLLEVQDAG